MRFSSEKKENIVLGFGLAKSILAQSNVPDGYKDRSLNVNKVYSC